MIIRNLELKALMDLLSFRPLAALALAVAQRGAKVIAQWQGCVMRHVWQIFFKNQLLSIQ
jgi:cytochrome c551/c552